MPFLLPQLARVEPYYAGDKPLPRRLERIAQLVAGETWTNERIAQAAGVSLSSLKRIKRHAAFRSRVAALAEQAAEQAMEAEPLARKGNRVALAGALARTLRDQLEANGYVTTLGVSKQGNPIVGFDRARVAEIRQLLSAIADELAEPVSKQAADTLAVSVTMTTDQAVTKVQALLSRASDEGPAPPGTPDGGWRGVSTGADTIREDRAVLDTEYKVISDAKGE